MYSAGNIVGVVVGGGSVCWLGIRLGFCVRMLFEMVHVVEQISGSPFRCRTGRFADRLTVLVARSSQLARDLQRDTCFQATFFGCARGRKDALARPFGHVGRCDRCRVLT